MIRLLEKEGSGEILLVAQPPSVPLARSRDLRLGKGERKNTTPRDLASQPRRGERV